MQTCRYGICGLLVMVLAVAGCGEDGDDGAPGMDGAPGEDGTNGTDGDDGAPGSDGDDGDDGRSGLLAQTEVGPGSDCEFGGIRVDTGVDDDGDGSLDEGEIDQTSFLCNREAAFTLQLLHFADVDSNEATALATVDEFSALVDGFRNDPVYGPNTLVVSSGDNVIPGPRWFAAENGTVRTLTGSNEPGHVDHFWMNQFGVAASALGNHELDQGPGEFADSISSESRGGVTFPGTEFPYLASNVDFSGDDDLSEVIGEDGLDHRLLAGQVAKSATFRVGRERVGIVGASTPQLPAITTIGDLVVTGSTTVISELAAEVQPAIDALVDDGVDKIIVVAHMQQISIEKALAEELTDVDIIVAGGSNTRMGDDTDALFPGDDAFDEDYPFLAMDADDNPTLIVNVDGDYKYLGRLVVPFDEDGIVIPGSIDDAVSGAYASTSDNVLLSGGERIPEVVTIRDAVQGVIVSQFENVIGHTDVFIEGRRRLVRTEETNLGNLTSDSLKWYSQQCDGITNVIALKNGGGIRAEIGNAVVVGETTTLNPPFNDGLDVEAGDVSEGHLRGTLRFDNGAVLLDVTGTELKTLLEHAVARSGPGATPGQFPQVGGISFGWNPSGTAQVLEFDDDDNVTGIQTAGSRITDIWVDTDGDFEPDTALYTDGVAQGAASATYTLVTLNFLANGGDSYPFALLSSPNRRQIYGSVGFGDPDEDDNDLPDFPVLTNCDPGEQSTFSSTGGEQDALAEYFLEFYPDPGDAFDIAETAPADDRRIQNLGVIREFIEP